MSNRRKWGTDWEETSEQGTRTGPAEAGATVLVSVHLGKLMVKTGDCLTMTEK